MSELKPCPFCGGEAKAFYCEKSGTFDVQCQVCGAIPYIGYRRGGMSPDEVIEAWNTRHEKTCQVKRDEHGIPRCGECECIVYDEYIDAIVNFCSNCGSKVVR